MIDVAVVAAVVCTAFVAAAEGDCFPALAGILPLPTGAQTLWR